MSTEEIHHCSSHSNDLHSVGLPFQVGPSYQAEAAFASSVSAKCLVEVSDKRWHKTAMSTHKTQGTGQQAGPIHGEQSQGLQSRSRMNEAAVFAAQKPP